MRGRVADTSCRAGGTALYAPYVAGKWAVRGLPNGSARVFLTSSDASFITGSEYVIDGGLLLGPALPAETA
ncbi:hypothetical protein [Gordonia amicalis]|uniref:hypothetical protein n=1 Tax=Gordonia TaxID=2053 RepID=UPI0013ACBE26|nr:hypothetical protein BPODLACK_00873 [Gordonia sp. YY1]MCZ0913577.1 hypothetical protein [Gordonia amicalis]